MDLTNEIKLLKDRLSTLEKKLNSQLSSNVLNQSYSSIGSTNSDFLIKTRGKIKIQWGKKFIDLLKDGKLNTDVEFFHQISSKSSIDKNKSGIYYATDEQSIYIVIGGNIFDLNRETGNSYISFLDKQNLTNEQKHIALSNIGFVYKSIDNFNLSKLTSGIVYIENEQKLYVVINGKLSEYNLSLPNPINDQVVINKLTNDDGSLVIQGTGLSNGLYVGNLKLYSSGINNYLNSDTSGSIIIQKNLKDLVTINNSNVIVNPNTVFNGDAISESFMSPGANETSGFKIYLEDGQSYVKADYIISRNPQSTIQFLLPSYFASENNVVNGATNRVSSGSLQLVLSLLNENKYIVNDQLYVYIPIKDESDKFYQMTLVSLIVTELIPESNSMAVDIQTDTLSMNSIMQNIIGQTIFLVKHEDSQSQLLKYSTNLDILSDDKVLTRIGNVDELNKSITISQSNSTGEVNISIKVPVTDQYGIYSSNLITDRSRQYNPQLYAAIFKGGPYLDIFPSYEDGLTLPTEDSSQIVVTSEWVRRFANSLIPIGTIVAWNGTEIPDGWAICDGTNNTPNLIGKFIKAGTTPGQEGGSQEITLTVDNLPPHTHTIETSELTTSEAGTHSHSLNYSNSNLGSLTVGNHVLSEGESIQTGESGSHTHTVDLSNVTLSTVGNQEPIEVEPSYYTLVYIMRIS